MFENSFVSLSDGIWRIINKEVNGKIADGDSGVIRYRNHTSEPESGVTYIRLCRG
jgi:hypothetical protein